MPALPFTIALGRPSRGELLSLCRAHPTITYLKPPLPGAVLNDVVFLEDGRLALQVALPDGEQQAWTLDPDSRLSSHRLGDVVAHAPLAVRPTASRSRCSSRAPRPRPRAARLSCSTRSQPARCGWSRPTLAPLRATSGLILVGRQSVAGGAARTSIRWLDLGSGQAEDLALLPSQVASGTWVWSPDA
ncbi:MAG: hypothetical protein E6I75_30950 [Chloroflexi bacterium]|nr:MAG: hypothetical protein E6I75_30950 [Chloroflexota bacterium]